MLNLDDFLKFKDLLLTYTKIVASLFSFFILRNYQIKEWYYYPLSVFDELAHAKRVQYRLVLKKIQVLPKLIIFLKKDFSDQLCLCNVRKIKYHSN